MLLKQGIVAEINAKDCTAKVNLLDLDNMLSPWMQIIYSFAFGDMEYFMPKIGSQVACILDENFETGVIIGATYSKKNIPPVNNENKFHKKFEDGTVIEYDKSAHILTCSSLGAINVLSATTISMVAPKINFTGEFLFEGEAKVNGQIKLNGKPVDGHDHIDPQGGKTGAF